MTTVPPADIRMSWRPFPEPIVNEYTNLSGKKVRSLYHGAIRIEWDSPVGLYGILTLRHDEPADWEELRPMLAELVERSYAAQPYAESYRRHLDSG